MRKQIFVCGFEINCLQPHLDQKLPDGIVSLCAQIVVVSIDGFQQLRYGFKILPASAPGGLADRLIQVGKIGSTPVDHYDLGFNCAKQLLCINRIGGAEIGSLPGFFLLAGPAVQQQTDQTKNQRRKGEKPSKQIAFGIHPNAGSGQNACGCHQERKAGTQFLLVCDGCPCGCGSRNVQQAHAAFEQTKENAKLLAKNIIRLYGKRILFGLQDRMSYRINDIADLLLVFQFTDQLGALLLPVFKCSHIICRSFRKHSPWHGHGLPLPWPSQTRQKFLQPCRRQKFCRKQKACRPPFLWRIL